VQRALELQHSHKQRRREATAGWHNHVRYISGRDCRSPASEQLLVQLTEQVRCPRTHARGRVDAMPSDGVHTNRVLHEITDRRRWPTANDMARLCRA